MIRALLIALFFPILASAQIDAVTVSLTGGRSNETWHGQANIRALNVELTHALSPRLDVGLSASPIRMLQPKSWFGDQYGDGDEHVNALAASLLLRYRFDVGTSFVEPFAEAATGPMYAEKAVPASTSRFNFVTQFGAGILLMPNGRVPILAGYRFLHLSNGGYSPRNPGLNMSAIVVGVRMKLR